MGKITDNLKYHLVDSTAILTISNPIFAVFEVGVTGMSDEVSIRAKVIASGLTYFAGMGWGFGKGRDLWRKVFKINDETKEKVQGLHDLAFAGVFNLGVVPLIYLLSGVDDPKQLAIGTGIAVAIGMAQGPLLGYSVGVGRDLAGISSCDRRTYPDLIKKQRPSVKKGIAASLVAASIGLMALVYSATPDNVQDVQPQITQEVTILENSVVDNEQMFKRD